MTPEKRIEVEFMRDEGWPDVEIAAQLGVELSELVGTQPAVVKRCKTPGCEHPSNTRYTRGIFAGLCLVCIEARRERASEEGKRTSAVHRRGITHRDRVLSRRAPPAAARAPVDPPKRALKPVEVMLVEVVEEFRDDEGHLEALLEQEMPRSARASCVTVKGGTTFSRAGLARRIAKQIATTRLGCEWWQVPMASREGYVRLAAQFVAALEEIAERSPVEGQARERPGDL